MLPKFTDAQDREWTVRIGAIDAMTLKDRHGLDILGSQDDLGRVAQAEPHAVLKVLDVALEEQLKAAGTTLPEMFNALDMEQARQAGEAVVEALILFFPKSHQELLAPTRNKYIQEAAKRRKEVFERMRAKLESPEMDAQIREDLDKAFKPIEEQLDAATPGNSSGSSSESSNSDSTGSPSGESDSASSSPCIEDTGMTNGSDQPGSSRSSRRSKASKSATGES